MNASEDVVDQITQLQWADVKAASELAASWLSQLTNTTITELDITPKPTSLNSFNGIALMNGEPVFFKSHSEPNGAVKELYNVKMLSEVGYNVVEPLFVEQRLGYQVAIYPRIDLPTIFDLVTSAETLGNMQAADIISNAEARESTRLKQIYVFTRQQAKNPEPTITQLFWERLFGPRFEEFYKDAQFQLSNNEAISFDDLLKTKFVINDELQPNSLLQLIENAREFAITKPDVTIIGHGDAHYGNVFLDDKKRFLYFDPAFAGRHSPVLDVVKPLFHNVFAEWMYFPERVNKRLALTVERSHNEIRITYSQAFSPLRAALYDVKQSFIDDVTKEFKEFSQHEMQLALMCCPLLTVNLSDLAKYPTAIGWLGIALTLQMGNLDSGQQFNFADNYEKWKENS